MQRSWLFMVSPNVGERFWKKVDKRGERECWPWRGALNAGGYGNFRVVDDVIKAHRIAYVLERGAIADHLLVLHHCNNRSCVNPLHLYAGTYTDNNYDAYEAGNRNRVNPKINYEIAQEMRRLYDTGQYSMREIGKMFGLGHASTWKVLHRVTWYKP